MVVGWVALSRYHGSPMDGIRLRLDARPHAVRYRLVDLCARRASKYGLHSKSKASPNMPAQNGLRRSVDSSCIAAIAYTADERALEVEFRNGSVYQYVEVPADAFDHFLRAQSKGRHLHRFIKKRYRYVET